MEEYTLTAVQARQFVLAWQGLLGPRRFVGRQGVLEYIRQAGSIQFDPVNVCGQNADILLFSRVSGYTRSMLHRLLYADRLLVDHWDKNMCIYPVEDWPCFARNREHFRGWNYTPESRAQVDAVLDEVRQAVEARGVLCSQDLAMNDKIDWPWAPTKLSRAALEYLYFTGEIIIHHKKGTQRHYAPAAAHLPAALLAQPDPHPTDEDFDTWCVHRRIAALGLLWNKASDAFLAIPDFSAQRRSAAFASLLCREAIVPCAVEGISTPLYCVRAALPFLQAVLAQGGGRGRLEFISPLDGLMWDRKLILALFGFDYKWEIYTPENQRKYGPYVLPVLYGSRFAGRIQLVAHRDEKLLEAVQFWPEADFAPKKRFAAALHSHLQRFARFNGCTEWYAGPQFTL